MIAGCYVQTAAQQAVRFFFWKLNSSVHTTQKRTYWYNFDSHLRELQTKHQSQHKTYICVCVCDARILSHITTAQKQLWNCGMQRIAISWKIPKTKSIRPHAKHDTSIQSVRCQFRAGMRWCVDDDDDDDDKIRTMCIIIKFTDFFPYLAHFVLQCTTQLPPLHIRFEFSFHNFDVDCIQSIYACRENCSAPRMALEKFNMREEGLVG